MKYTVKVGQIYDCRGIGLRIVGCYGDKCNYRVIKKPLHLYRATMAIFSGFALIEDVP